MDITDALAFEIIESSQTGEARREIAKYAHNLGFSEASASKLDLICAEMSTNLLKHTARGGRLLVQGLVQNQIAGLEIYSMDSGRGMDTSNCVEDGYSSTGTMGTGLGAIKRNSHDFQIYSEWGQGSVIMARLWNENDSASVRPTFAALDLPKPGELVSGDKVCVVQHQKSTYCLVVDGLGHGIEAFDAAALAVKRFKQNIGQPPSMVLKAIHSALRGSRGAVGAIAQIDRENGKLYFCGLGNIAGIIVDETDRKHLTSLNGTLGYEGRRFTEFTLPWKPKSMLIMHTDGLSSKTFEDVYSIYAQPACMIAAWLFQKYSKGNDDSTILVQKH